jgi:hypothetical protein
MRPPPEIDREKVSSPRRAIHPNHYSLFGIPALGNSRESFAGFEESFSVIFAPLELQFKGFPHAAEDFGLVPIAHIDVVVVVAGLKKTVFNLFRD